MVAVDGSTPVQGRAAQRQVAIGILSWIRPFEAGEREQVRKSLGAGRHRNRCQEDQCPKPYDQPYSMTGIRTSSTMPKSQRTYDRLSHLEPAFRNSASVRAPSRQVNAETEIRSRSANDPHVLDRSTSLSVSCSILRNSSTHDLREVCAKSAGTLRELCGSFVSRMAHDPSTPSGCRLPEHRATKPLTSIRPAASGAPRKKFRPPPLTRIQLYG